MRHTQSLTLILGCLSSLVTAVFKDEVGDIDFHHALLGLPQIETTFFHRPRKEDKASLLYTLSDVGVVGAVNPTNGELLWRHQVADEVANGGGFLRAPDGENWVAAAHGSRVHCWNALTGRNIWDMKFEGEIRDVEIMEVTETSRKDVLVLSEEDGKTVLRRLHSGLGSVIWEFRETSKDLPLQVSTNIANIHIVSLHGSPASYSLRVTSLDIATGGRVDQTTIGTKGEVHEPKDVMFVGANSAAPILAWANPGLSKLSIHVLGGKGKQDLALTPDATDVQILAPHSILAQPHFLIHTRTSTGNLAEVYHTDLKTGQVSKEYDLPFLPGNGAFATSSDGANVYFTRVSEDELTIVSSESHGVLAHWPRKGQANVQPLHAVCEVIKKIGNEGFAVRAAVVTDEENWVMIRNGQQDWSRPEGLSGSVAAAYSEIPEAEALAKLLEEEAQTNVVSAYIHRMVRHLNDLRDLPAYLTSLPARFLSSLVGGESATKLSPLTRDTFGFSKVIVLATQRGRIYGLDSGVHGQVAWSKKLFPQPAGQRLDIRGILANDEDGTVELRGSKGEQLVIQATTGHVVSMKVAQPSIQVFTTAITSNGGLLTFGSDGKVTDVLSIEDGLEETVVVRTKDGTLRGVRIKSKGNKVVEQEAWQLQIFPGQKLADVATQTRNNPVASIGRVLGDRQVYYKYLNPNAIVAAIADEKARSLSVQLIDAVSGQVLASQSHNGVDASKPISCTIAENWYACSFFGQFMLDDETNRLLKGYQVVVSDFYESATPNDRGPMGDGTNFSSLEPVDSYTGVPLPYVVSQAWVISQPMSQLSVSQTRQGIANKQIIAYLPESNSIVGIPRQILDPRRPVGRDATAPELEAEGLMRYSPSIEIDPRTIISHERDVVGIKGIVASTTISESTSLLLAYGIDVYGSRVAPSGVFDILGDGFNKITLIGTVVALFGGVMFLSPMVRRKQINRRWEAPT